MQTIRNDPRRRKFDRRVAPVRRGLVLIVLELACFSLSPLARAAVVGPPQNDNTADGFDALHSLTTGNNNTAVGAFAMQFNTSGIRNTAIGGFALNSNTTGIQNTGIGEDALLSNTTGISNTAIGGGALRSNTTGIRNTADGIAALFGNTTGDRNTATGRAALTQTTTGARNTADGHDALFSNTTGNDNIALGNFAGFNLDTGDSNIDIGNQGLAGESNTIRIGDPAVQTATFMAGIRGTTTGNADAITVVIDSAGQLGTMSSSRRFKKEIKPMDQTSEAILALKPVTFHYKNDAKGRAQFGLIAEEVNKVNPDLVARDATGEIYTVRYEAVNAMLLNEFLKEHRTVEELKSTVAKQEAIIAKQQNGFESKIARQQKQIEALTADLQKVSAQVEMSKSAPRMVGSNQ